jgi:hypothetical protein
VVALSLMAAPVLLGVAFGNWFAGFGPALVVFAVVFYRRWNRNATRL